MTASAAAVLQPLLGYADARWECINTVVAALRADDYSSGWRRRFNPMLPRIGRISFAEHERIMLPGADDRFLQLVW